MARKRKAYRTKYTKKRWSSKKGTSGQLKRKLAGFTRIKKKYVLVFKKGKKMSIGKSKYSSKTSLQKAATKYL